MRRWLRRTELSRVGGTSMPSTESDKTVTTTSGVTVLGRSRVTPSVLRSAAGPTP